LIRPSAHGATVVIVVDAIAMNPQEAYDFGMDLVTASVRRVPMESLDPRVKSLNCLNDILASEPSRPSAP
jgi:branched-chain amino acid aminotransferase